MDQRLTYTVDEAAQLLGIGRGTAYDAVRTGDIPSVRIGRRVLIPRKALLALVGAAPHNNVAPAGNGRDGKASGADARLTA